MTYTPEALAAAASLSSRYLPDRFLPDKAIDLMDEAGALAQIAAFEGRTDCQVGAEDVAKVVAAWTGIPINKLTADEAKQMLDFEDTLHKYARAPALRPHAHVHMDMDMDMHMDMHM